MERKQILITLKFRITGVVLRPESIRSQLKTWWHSLQQKTRNGSMSRWVPLPSDFQCIGLKLGSNLELFKTSEEF